MDQPVYIKMDGASILGAHILSFSSEKEFVSAKENEYFMHHADIKVRRQLLKSMYKVAQKTVKP